MKYILFFILSIAFFAGIYIPSAHAQATMLAISPPVFTISLQAGDSSNQTLKLYNSAKTPEQVSIEIKDFTQNSQNGHIILQAAGSEGIFSLSSYISINTTDKVIPAGSVLYIPFRINIPAQISSGSRYSAITCTTIPITNTGSQTEETLTSLVYTNINGNTTLKHDVAIQSFHATNSFWATPITFSANLDNNGNFGEAISGTISIANISGKHTTNLTIHSFNLLPSTKRIINEDLNAHNLFGRYSATLQIHYDGKLLENTIQFWVIPTTQVAEGIIIFLIISINIFFFIKIVLTKKEQNPRQN